MKALGLLCVCLSLDPKTWTFSIRGLDAICKDGRTAIIHALDELEDLGYLRRSRVQERKEDGGFGHTHYVFYDKPHPKDAPCTRFVYTDDPHTENLPQEITKQETKKLKSPQKPPEGRSPEPPPGSPLKNAKSPKSMPKHRPEEFERLWEVYPRGEDRKKAVALWDEMKPDDETIAAMKITLLRQKQTEDWKRGIGIPYFVRWLRYERWTDEVRNQTPPPAPSVPYEPEVRTW